MNWETWVAILIVAIPGILSLTGQIAGVVSARNGQRVDAASKITDSAMDVADRREREIVRLETRISALEFRLTEQEERIAELEADNTAWQREYRYLWDGNSENVHYIEHELKKIAPFKPTIDRFRGSITYDGTGE